jgi:hypothetical protein
MFSLNDIKYVDLKASDWDKDASDREKGSYFFKKKVYIDYQSVRAPRPMWVFKWVYNSPYAIEDWKQKWLGAELVSTTNDDYWPEGASIENGHYVYKDVILMKIPLAAYIDQRRKEMGVANTASDAIQRGFSAECGPMGLSKEEIESLLPKIPAA